jgi:hypothetical protein
MHMYSRPRWQSHLFATATISVLALAALVLPAQASADDHDGVRAALKRGTLDVKGGDEADTVALRLSGDQTQIEVDGDGPADDSFSRADVAEIRVRMGDGDDSARIDDANGAFTNAIPTTIAGGDGDDSLEGGQQQAVAQNETYKGGDGDDAVDGGRGNDAAHLGDGSDSFRWDPGEGSDLIEGQDGTDTMVFNGAGLVDTVTMTAEGKQLTFLRQPGNVRMDTDGVEVVDFNALGGADRITVDDLTDTAVTQVNLDFADTLGGAIADGAIDTVEVNGTDGEDSIDIEGNGAWADVTGLAAVTSVEHADPTDVLSVNTLAGADDVVANGVDGVLRVLVDGAEV